MSTDFAELLKNAPKSIPSKRHGPNPIDGVRISLVRKTENGRLVPTNRMSIILNVELCKIFKIQFGSRWEVRFPDGYIALVASPDGYAISKNGGSGSGSTWRIQAVVPNKVRIIECDADFNAVSERGEGIISIKLPG